MATPQSSCAATGVAIRPPPTSEIATAEPRTTRESFIRDAPPLCPLAERWTNRRRSSAARRTSGPLHLKPTAAGLSRTGLEQRADGARTQAFLRQDGGKGRVSRRVSPNARPRKSSAPRTTRSGGEPPDSALVRALSLT